MTRSLAWFCMAAFLGLAVNAGAQNTVSIVTGNRQFYVSSSFPAEFPEYLTVIVANEAGAPVAGIPVRFVVSSPRGDIVVEGGPTYETMTNQAGKAFWAGLKGLAGRGFFNVTADTVPPSAKAAVFLLSQNPTPECGLPGPRYDTSTQLSVSPTSGSSGSTFEFVATTIEAVSRVPVLYYAIGVMDNDRILVEEPVPSDVRTGTIRESLNLSPGAYVLRARFLDGCVYRRSESPAVVLPVSAGIPPTGNFSDMWWKSSESGWGMSVLQHATGQLFVVWFHYRQDGSPYWFVIPGGAWTNATTFTGAMYRTSGPTYGGVFDSSKVAIVPVGVATLAFSSADRGTFTWSMDGVNAIKSIERQPF